MNTMTPKQVMWIRVMTSTWRHFLVAGHTCPALSLLLPASWVKTKFALADNVDWLAGFHSSLFPISIPRDAKNCIFRTCLQLRCWIGITFHLLDMFWKDLEDENEVRTILLFFSCKQGHSNNLSAAMFWSLFLRLFGIKGSGTVHSSVNGSAFEWWQWWRRWWQWWRRRRLQLPDLQWLQVW